MSFRKTFSPSTDDIKAACNKPLHPSAEEGIQLFNQGKYLPAHESFEKAWQIEPDPDRRLYQGILQAGIAYMHARNGYAKGVFTMYERCRVWLWPWPDHCRSIDVGQIKNDLQRLVDEIKRLGPKHLAELDQSFFTMIKRV